MDRNNLLFVRWHAATRGVVLGARQGLCVFVSNHRGTILKAMVTVIVLEKKTKPIKNGINCCSK